MKSKKKEEKDFQQVTNEYAHGAIETLREMLDEAEKSGDDSRIQEDPLSVQVRSDWYQPGDSDAAKPTEYELLLGTGGPASRIVGDLDSYGQPTSARFEYQDWGTPWTKAETTSEEDDTMLEYARHFWFGD